MDEPLTTKRLVVLRKLTRAIADHLRGQLKDHLTALAPLFRPRTVLGEYVKSDVKEFVKGAEAAYKDLQSQYARVASVRPFSLAAGLKSPVEVTSGVPEMIPVDYTHTAKTEQDSKAVTVIPPLKWLLCYGTFTPQRMRTLLADQNRTTTDVESAVQHFMMLHTVVTRQPALVKLLELLRFSISIGKAEGLGELPIVTIASMIPTFRPPDELIIESTEMSGTDSFEEVVDPAEIAKLSDPVRDKLVEIAKGQGVEVGAG